MEEVSHHHHNEYMLSVEEALDRILASFTTLESERKPVLEALGQVLSETIISSIDIPPLDNSAMDGYAVQADSITKASETAPAMLKVTGTVSAGEIPSKKVELGTAIRIMTGAPIPDGADTIVPFEETDEMARRQSHQGLSEIGIRVPCKQGLHIRKAGQDVRAGEVVLESGITLRPPEAGVIASLGYKDVAVIRRPIVGILSTGNELLEPGFDNQTGKIYDSNSHSVAAGVIRNGGDPRILGIAKDNLGSMNSKLEEGLETDLLITSAGVSKGDYDMVKDVLALRGQIDFWSVRMRPAKPLAFGVLHASDGKNVPHIGLPGNPVSALVAFEQFGRPAIRKMMGKQLKPIPTIQAILDEPVTNSDKRRVYARVTVSKRDGVYHAKLAGSQGSNLLTSMTRSNGLAICPEDLKQKDVGDVVEVQMLDWPEEVF